VCHRLLKPGGFLYLCEFHPVGAALDSGDQPLPKHDYFDTEPIVWNESGTYADLQADTAHNLCYDFNHPLPQVFDALIGTGFQLRFFHEWDHTLFEMAKWLVKDPGSQHFRWPGPGKLPLMYSLKAEKARI
jgi:hypothetical protein